MRRWLITLGLLVGLLALLACAAEEKATPAPVGPTAAAKPAWEEEWQRVLAAAKQEGTVAILGVAGTERRDALTEGFEKKYGIKVEYLGGRGPEFSERLRTERGAGQYLWDINIGGLTHWLPYLNQGWFDPIGPALIQPEVKEGKHWWGGGPLWLDGDRRFLAMFLSTSNPIFINTKLVKPEEIKSFKDLLDPKWKGKLLSDDPRIAGASLSQYTFFYLHPNLGPDFIRALAKQEITVTRDRQQQLEWLAQGKYPILVGGSRGTAVPLIREGLPIMNMDPRGIKEGASLAVGSGHLFLISRAPHPNAAKVYINWVLSKEAQTEFARADGSASLRLDVPTDHLDPWEVPQEGYIKQYGPKAEEVREVARKLTEEVFGR